MPSRRLVFDWDRQRDHRRYLAQVQRAAYVPGVTFLRMTSFACGGQRHEVAIFRHDPLAVALGVLEADPDQRVRHTPREVDPVTDIACEFVAIPGGVFEMGSDIEEFGRLDSEGPRRWVIVPPFLLGRVPVTQRLWEALAADGGLPRSGRVPGHSRAVMTNVSWEMVTPWIDGANRAHGSTLRLPSEAEWEYACRAGTTTPYFWGVSDEEEDAKQFAWYERNADRRSWTEPHAAHEGPQHVALKRPNAFGLHDMTGNVWEWCADRWEPSYEGMPDDPRPRPGDDASSRSQRGGSWLTQVWGLRSASRFGIIPGYQDANQGFRLACSVAIA